MTLHEWAKSRQRSDLAKIEQIAEITRLASRKKEHVRFPAKQSDFKLFYDTIRNVPKGIATTVFYEFLDPTEYEYDKEYSRFWRYAYIGATDQIAIELFLWKDFKVFDYENKLSEREIFLIESALEYIENNFVGHAFFHYERALQHKMMVLEHITGHGVNVITYEFGGGTYSTTTNPGEVLITTYRKTLDDLDRGSSPYRVEVDWDTNIRFDAMEIARFYI